VDALDGKLDTKFGGGGCEDLVLVLCLATHVAAPGPQVDCAL
jgi:hypothetical protein